MLTINTYLAMSKIQGMGCFAAEFIPKGALIWIFNPLIDQLLTDEDIEKLASASREQILKYFYFDIQFNKFVLVGDDSRFMNHSTEPTCLDIHSETENATIAARDIEIGEELTCDYSVIDGRHNPSDYPVSDTYPASA